MINANSSPQDYEAYRYRLKKERTPPEVLIAATSDSKITTAGNITVITGPPKSGKTAIANAIIAGNLTETPSIDTLGLTITPNKARNGVVYINTELSDADFDKFNEAVIKRAKLTEVPAYYRAYNFNSFDIGQLKEATRTVIEIANRDTGIRIVVIDGIADYVRSVNNEEDCNEVIRQCIENAKNLKAAVVLIIHNNPGIDKKSRGHLGSQVERKCETMLEVRMHPAGYSLLKSKFARNSGGFDPICFKYNPELGYHVFWCNESKLKEGKKALEELKSEEEEKDFLTNYYDDKRSIPCAKFISIIMDYFEIKDRSAKTLISKWKKLEWLITTDEGYRVLVKKA